MSKGQEQLQSAIDLISESNLEEDLRVRVSKLIPALEELKESTFARSALSVPLTAAVNRAAKALSDEGSVDELEKAVADVSGKAGGAGKIAIT